MSEPIPPAPRTPDVRAADCVIVKFLRGRGVPDDPIREVTRIFEKVDHGLHMLAECDPMVVPITTWVLDAAERALGSHITRQGE